MLIQNGLIARAGEDQFARIDIRICEGRIVELGENLVGDGDRLDARGMYVLPGGIDPHVHFNDPGYTQREDFYHGNCAAASGGITTVIDMPCTSIPPITSRRNLLQKLEAIQSQSLIDFGLYGGVSSQSLERGSVRAMEELAGDVLGFKTYFISAMKSFGRLDHYQFERVLMTAREVGLPVLLHAEDYDYVRAATRARMREGSDPLCFYRSRPELAEILAVQAALVLADKAGADLHIVHIGTAEAARLLAQGGATGETAPHYLAFSLRDFVRMGSPLKVTPPVKSEANKAALWELLADGTLDFVASDHAPCQKADKETGSIWTDYSGIPGSGTLLPFLFSEGYLKGRLSLKRLVEVTAEGAARRYGIASRKGSIAVGKDGDLVLIDPRRDWIVEGRAFYSKGKITPFEGMAFRGRVVKTILRGRVIYDVDRGIVASPGSGAFLRRQE
jgi:allantoinase